jgi:hypothetical protein
MQPEEFLLYVNAIRTRLCDAYNAGNIDNAKDIVDELLNITSDITVGEFTV